MEKYVNISFMKKLTVVIYNTNMETGEAIARAIPSSDIINSIVIFGGSIEIPKYRPFSIKQGTIYSKKGFCSMLDIVHTDLLMLVSGESMIWFEHHGLKKMLKEACVEKTGMVYADYYEIKGQRKTVHPLNDYQMGSVRDDFDFGKVIVFSVPSIRYSMDRYGFVPDVRYSALYDIRLKISVDHMIHHIPEPLYAVIEQDENIESSKHFDYVDPKHRETQKELEMVFTRHLKRINAYIDPGSLKYKDKSAADFPCEASVIIPVKNRKRTIVQAIESALTQKTDFSYNVIVVDNHSQDGTSEILRDMAIKHHSLVHIIPNRIDLAIGGCWNEAVFSRLCGRYAVQLDSDDLYINENVLQVMVDMIREGRYAMVIGSYTVVDFNLSELPPGLIDHREWTDDNGHNNALRINGLGAPRGFDTELIRKIRFLNVSYGEDYCASLRICREYRIGRIFESLYLCRRWSDNTDGHITLYEKNRNDAFKDKLRTDEILARIELNKRMER